MTFSPSAGPHGGLSLVDWILGLICMSVVPCLVAPDQLLDGRLGGLFFLAAGILQHLAGLALAGLSVLAAAARLGSRRSWPRLRSALSHQAVYGLVGYVVATLGAAGVYRVLSARDPGAFTEQLSRVDSVYFAFVTGTTTGFGDINPLSEVARAAVAFHLLVGVLVLLNLAGVWLSAAVGLLRAPEAP